MNKTQKKEKKYIKSVYLTKTAIDVFEEMKKAGFKQSYIVEQAILEFYNKLKQQNRI